MPKIQIYPHNKDVPVDTMHIPYTYLHGRLQDDHDYDVFSFKAEVEPVVNTINVYNDIVFYYWETDRPHGLVCYTYDKEAIQHAEAKFKAKAEFI